MDYSDFETLPDIFDALPEITHLSVHGNVLAELPPSLFRLPNLVWLDLSGNKLKRLPDEIKELTGLTHLNIAGNHLRALPDAICKLRHLEELVLWGNKLKKLPKGLGSLAKLTKLYPATVSGLRTTPRTLVQFFERIAGIKDLRKNVSLVMALAKSCLDEETVTAFRCPLVWVVTATGATDKELAAFPGRKIRMAG